MYLAGYVAQGQGAQGVGVQGMDSHQAGHQVLEAAPGGGETEVQMLPQLGSPLLQLLGL